jgi:arylformamidase
MDTMDSVMMDLHRLLFKNDVLILENLQSLSRLRQRRFSICALPLLYENGDGAPARVMAWLE